MALNATVATSGHGTTESDLLRELVLQRTLFSGPQKWVNDDLYSRIERGLARRTRSRLHLEPGAIVHTNTYFGRFEASYWQRWTDVETVKVRVEIESEGQVDVLVRASDIGSHERTVNLVHHFGDGMAVLDVPVDTFADGGGMWLEFVAVDAPAIVSNVQWSTITSRPARRATIAICTFNRADDCAATVSALAADPVVFELIDDLYVTDQGTDTVASRPEFNAVAEEFGDRMHYIRQPNLGGSGGFSRGMYEATATGGKEVDVLLMDDDVRVEPEAVVRLFAFATVTLAPTLVGAQMLYLFNPDYLHISAETADLNILARGVSADEFILRNESAVENLDDRRHDAGYVAWWTCLIPGEVIDEVGLSLPLFVQWDDIEYSLRARAAGFSTVTLQGAAVWHADFYWKDVDEFSEVFTTRNGLVTAAVSQSFNRGALARELSRQVLRAITAMQYGLAATRLRGIEAFLDGPSGRFGVSDGSQGLLAGVREERAAYPDTARHSVNELPANIGIAKKGPEPETSRIDFVLGKRLLWQELGRTRREPVAVPFEDNDWWHVSLFDEAYVTDASQTGVRHRRFDKATARELSARLATLLKRFHSESDAAQQAWREAAQGLTSRENWARLYGV